MIYLPITISAIWSIPFKLRRKFLGNHPARNQNHDVRVLKRARSIVWHVLSTTADGDRRRRDDPASHSQVYGRYRSSNFGTWEISPTTTITEYCTHQQNSSQQQQNQNVKARAAVFCWYSWAREGRQDKGYSVRLGLSKMSDNLTFLSRMLEVGGLEALFIAGYLGL